MHHFCDLNFCIMKDEQINQGVKIKFMKNFHNVMEIWRMNAEEYIKTWNLILKRKWEFLLTAMTLIILYVTCTNFDVIIRSSDAS